MNNYSTEQSVMVLGLVVVGIVVTPWALLAMAFIDPNSEG